MSTRDATWLGGAADDPLRLGNLSLPVGLPARMALLLGFFVVLGAIGYALLGLGAPVEDEGVTSFEAVEVAERRTHGDASEMVQSSELPLRCVPEGDGWTCVLQLRVAFAHDVADEDLRSLYVPHFAGDLEVRLNGVSLAESAWSQSSFYLGQRSPLLVPMPAPLLRHGSNTVDLVMASQLAFGGFIGKFYVGPDHVLRPHYEQTRLMVVTIPRMIDGWLIAMGVFVLVIWILRPRERVYLLFAAIVFSFAAGSLPAILLDAPGDDLLRFANLGRVAAGSLTLPFACRFVGRRLPVPDAVFLLPFAVTVLVFALLPGDPATWLFGHVLGPLTLVLAASAAAVFGHAALRERSDAGTLLLGVMIIGIVLAGRDLMMLGGMLEDRHVMLGRYNSALLIAAMGVLLSWRFVAAITLLEQFNTRLRQAVAEAEADLRRSFAREREQTRRAALQTERMRLMSDLHDGIAGHLVSILSRCELRRDAADDEIAQASRYALADLRLVVASLEDVGDDLNLMLAMFRERIEPQLRATGIRLAWHVGPLPDLPGMNPAATLAIFRVLQEAVVNAMKHSRTPVVEISADWSPAPGYGMRLEVRDRGRGGVAERRRGFGLDSMRRRAAAIGAGLSVESSGDGTSVTLDLPKHLETAG